MAYLSTFILVSQAANLTVASLGGIDAMFLVICYHMSTQFGAIIICVISINLIMASGPDLFLYIAFVNTVLLQILLYAVGGTRVAESVSENRK